MKSTSSALWSRRRASASSSIDATSSRRNWTSAISESRFANQDTRTLPCHRAPVHARGDCVPPGRCRLPAWKEECVCARACTCAFWSVEQSNRGAGRQSRGRQSWLKPRRSKRASRQKWTRLNHGSQKSLRARRNRANLHRQGVGASEASPPREYNKSRETNVIRSPRAGTFTTKCICVLPPSLFPPSPSVPMNNRLFMPRTQFQRCFFRFRPPCQ